MSDSISRQAAIDIISKDKIDSNSLKIMSALGNGNEALTVNMTCDRHIQLLKNLPSTQPELIHCKDCKHRPKSDAKTTGFDVEFPDHVCPCQCEDGYYNWIPGDDFYCARAERRTDE